MNHTPGPWWPSKYHYCQNVYARVKKYPSEDECRIARAEEGWCGCDEARANANLIAAAPDLLAVVEGSIQLIEHARLIDAPDCACYDDYLRAARAAMAKARGEK